VSAGTNHNLRGDHRRGGEVAGDRNRGGQLGNGIAGYFTTAQNVLTVARMESRLPQPRFPLSPCGAMVAFAGARGRCNAHYRATASLIRAVRSGAAGTYNQVSMNCGISF